MIPILEVASPTGTFRHRLRPGETRFGRAADCDIFVRDKLVSGRHAIFTLGPDAALRVRDLGSTNGVFVNGVRRAETGLRSGDTIRAGSTILVYAEEPEGEVGLQTNLELAVVEERKDETGFDPFSITVGVDEIAADLGAEPDTAAMASNALLVARTRLSLLYRLGHGAACDANLDDLLTHIAQVVREGVGPERIALLVSETEGAPAVRRFARNWRRQGESSAVYVPRLVVATAMYERKVVLFNDLIRDPRFRDEPRLGEVQIRQAMAAPILFSGKVRGAIYCDRASADPPFTAEELYVLGIVAYQSGAFLQNQETFSRERAALEALRQAQGDLVRAAKLATIGELLAGVANEINNPVAAIVGYSELIQGQSRADDGCPYKSEIARIHESSLRVKVILDQLLAFCRRRPGAEDAFDLEKTLREILVLKERDVRQRGISLEMDFLRGIPPVAGDAAQIQQVVHHLVRHAESALEGVGGGRISVTGRCDHERCHVSVERNGPPIAPELLPRLFDPYHAPDPKGLGHGLGLTIAAAIVRQHGGKLDVESPVGAGAAAGGARFRIELPLKLGAPLPVNETASLTPLPPEVLAQALALRSAATSPAAPAPAATDATPSSAASAATGAGARTTPPSPEPKPAARPRVLVCDDEPFIRDLVFRALSKDGYEVVPCASGEEALEKIAAATFDAVVTDVHLGGLDGLALAERAASLRPALERRFIFITGDTASDTYRALLERGAPVLAKPFDLAALRGRVGSCVTGGARSEGT